MTALLALSKLMHKAQSAAMLARTFRQDQSKAFYGLMLSKVLWRRPKDSFLYL